MNSRYVQFRSSAEALKAFDNVGCEAWSLWQGKNLLFKGVGSGDLQTFLDMIEQNEMGAGSPYTVCYYEDIEDKKKINNKTPYDGSFSFVINADAEEIISYRKNKIVGNNLLESKIGSLEQKLDDLLSEREDTETSNRLGVIGELLEHPTIAQVLPGILQKIFGSAMGTAATIEPIPLARVSGVGALPVLPEIEESVQQLNGVDPKLREHLAKLSWIALNDPSTFNMVMGAIDSYAIPG